MAKPIATAVFLLMLAPTALGQTSADDRLDSVKNALIDQALSQPVSVRSAAWLDENGVLHEQTRFQSEARVRGIRIPSYLPKPAASEPVAKASEAVLAPGAELSANDSVLRPSETGDGCQGYPTFQRSGVLELEVHTAPGSAAAGYARQVEAETRRLILRRFQGEPGWRLAPRHEAQELDSPYERAVYEGPINRRPLTLTLALAVREGEPTGSWWRVDQKLLNPVRQNFGEFRQAPRNLAVDLELRLSAPGAPEFLWSGYDSFTLARRENNDSPQLQPSDVARIYQTLNNWFSLLAARQACEAPRFAVQGQIRGQFIINGGRNAGLRPGDKVILADGLRTPQDVLNSGVTETMALAQVAWTDAEEAGLTLLSGTAPQSGAALVAIPL